MTDAPDDEIPFQFDEPHLSLDPACPTCHGTGVREDGDRLLECTCLLRQRVLHYLTPQYGPGIKWDPDFRPEPYRGKDVLLANTAAAPDPQYRDLAFAAVKSFLLVTGRRFSHRTLTPYDISQRYLANRDAHGLDELAERVDVLIIVFGIDPPNVAYKSVLPWLIRQRRDRGLVTWILSSVGLNTPDFKQKYLDFSEPLVKCLADGFVELRLPQSNNR